MPLLKRLLKNKVDRSLKRGKSILLLGPRQTGKTTLINQYPADLEITLLFSKSSTLCTKLLVLFWIQSCRAESIVND